MPNARTLKPGDVVRLKSGGPKMTVSSLSHDQSDDSVWCVWFVADKKEAADFHEPTLKIEPEH